jgi:rhomboid protease GluP
MDLNFIALWFAVIPAATLLWQGARAGRRALGWTVVSSLVLSIALAGWLSFRDVAGYVAVLCMLVFLLIPSRLSHAAARASEQQRFGRARRLAQLAMILHPVAEWRVLPRVFHAFELAQSGELAEAEALLQVLARDGGSIAPMAAAQRLRLLGRWRELKQLGEREGLLTLRTQPTLFALYLRALGELGYVDDLAKFLLAQETILPHTGAQDLALLYLFAFTGQVELTAQLLSAKSRSYAPEIRDFWQAVALQSAGRPEQARRAFGLLRSSKDAQIRARAEERFNGLARAVPEEPASPQTLAVVQRFAQKFTEKRHFALNEPKNRGKNRLTLALVAVNTGVYVFGSFPGLRDTRESFVDRWAFVAADVLRGEWWRVLSYLFVHANALHLLMNLGGLWVLGPSIERAFGRVRFSIIYLFSGCAGSAIYLALALFQRSEEHLVGASGCIMGLLGANAAVMLRAWLKHRAPMARQLFLRLLAVVALQVVFDYSANHSNSTGPQIAALAHIAGVMGGFFCALLLRDRMNPAHAADYAH